MRFKSLSELKRPEIYEVVLGVLPDHIRMTRYARAKAFKINELVREIHKESFEWYGYTLAKKNEPEIIEDIGLPPNEHNLYHYTSIDPGKIAGYQDSLPSGVVINGWIHSHGNLEFKRFSGTDEENHVTVLDYVSAQLRRPVSKREVVVKDFAFLLRGEYTERDLQRGSVCLITDAPVSEARILETIYGSFCYCIVIGDEGWHEQEIYYKKRGILSGETSVNKRDAELSIVDTGRLLTPADIEILSQEVEERLQPITVPPPERIERM